jgi:hypothetical protein
MLTCNRVMTTHTFLFRPSLLIILIMLLSICSHSMLLYHLDRESRLMFIEATRPRDKSYRMEHTMNNLVPRLHT